MYTIIIANAPGFRAEPFAKRITSADLVIAADGGGNALYASGITPDLIIGDCDSLDPVALAAFTTAGVPIIRYPSAKDETDLELALLAAIERGATQIDLLGALGGRWDQGLANVALLALPELRSVRVRLLDDTQEAYVVQGVSPIEGSVGDTVSLIPLGGAASGITTTGLHYALADATLAFARSRGISNVISSLPAQVSVREGILLIVHHVKSGQDNL